LGIKNVKTIHNGIDVNTPPPLKHNAKKELRHIYNIARISPEKNQLTILKALMLLENKHLTIVGKVVDEKYYISLIDFINLNSINDRVTFEPFNSDITNLYSNADIVILPSYEEGLSNVILECFKFGVPCFASDIPANKYVLQKRGILFPADDYNLLAKEIINFEKLPNSAKENMLRKNYFYLKDNFSLTKNVEAYKSLIDSL
jgi:glycosyltransferase involved in cell wall biosynthesis